MSEYPTVLPCAPGYSLLVGRERYDVESPLVPRVGEIVCVSMFDRYRATDRYRVTEVAHKMTYGSNERGGSGMTPTMRVFVSTEPAPISEE